MYVRVLDAASRIRSGIACVQQLSAAGVNSHMTGIAYNITRLHIGLGYPAAHTAQRAGGMGQRYTEVRVYRHNESGTIRAIGQAAASPYVSVADKLRAVAYNRASALAGGAGGTAGGNVFTVRTGSGRSAGRNILTVRTGA